MALKILKTPPRYVQGPDALFQIGIQLESIGVSNPLVVASPSAMTACRDAIASSLTAKNMACTFTEFNRISSMKEIHRIRDLCLDENHDAIIACGGGAAMDAGRAAAGAEGVTVAPYTFHEKFGAGVPCIQVPTVAASDAATAASSVIYSDDGLWENFVMFQKNPDLILADTQVIARAPVRTLVAGMGDAIATCFETEVSQRTATPTFAGGMATMTALHLARLTFEILTTYGPQAIVEAEAKIPGPALEAVVEANILLSGLGYENGGLAAAHALATAFSRQQGIFKPMPYHGEVVAFCTLAQLIMEETDPEKLQEVYYFNQAVGLPTSFEELGLGGVSEDALTAVAEETARSLLMLSMPKANPATDGEGRFYDVNEILIALKLADQYSQLGTDEHQCNCDKDDHH